MRFLADAGISPRTVRDILALGVLTRPSVILLRLTSERPERVNQQLQSVLAERQMELEAGALILIEDARYRLRKLPIGSTR